MDVYHLKILDRDPLFTKVFDKTEAVKIGKQSSKWSFREAQWINSPTSQRSPESSRLIAPRSAAAVKEMFATKHDLA